MFKSAFFNWHILYVFHATIPVFNSCTIQGSEEHVFYTECGEYIDQATRGSGRGGVQMQRLKDIWRGTWIAKAEGDRQTNGHKVLE